MVQKLTVSTAPPASQEAWVQDQAASSIPGKNQVLCFTACICNSPKAPEGPQEKANGILHAGNSPNGVQSYELKC